MPGDVHRARPAWRPAPLLVVSGGLHLALLATVCLRPALWPGCLGLLLLNHLLLSLCGLLPRCTWLGPTLIRLPEAARLRGEVALTFDDGPDPDVTPQVLDLLAAHNVRATFFCIGQRAAAHPELCRALVDAGHEVANHGHRHPWSASLMGPGGWHDEISQGQATLQRLTSQTPRFYRAVAGLRNPFLAPVLHRLGLPLAAWTRRAYDTRCGDPDVVLRRLTHRLAAGDILLLHDGHGARTPQGEPVVLAVLPRLLAQLASQGLRPVTLSHACTPT